MVNARELWNQLMQTAKFSELEVPTVPRNRQTPKWFRVEAKDNVLVIKRASTNSPGVEINNDRRISFKDFELVCGFYDSWHKGEVGVRREVANKSRNTAYIFGLIHAVNTKS